MMMKKFLFSCHLNKITLVDVVVVIIVSHNNNNTTERKYGENLMEL